MSSAVSSIPSTLRSPDDCWEFANGYRRESTPPPTVENRAELAIDQGDRENDIQAPFYPDKSQIHDRLRPIPEKRTLGYLSTTALIINKMIGTGIFSKPSDILKSTGSKGASMLIWVTGGLMTLSGLLIYLEFGIAFPFNGGELVYLERSYTKPEYFASCMFGIVFVLLGNTAANSIAFAKNMIGAFSDNENPDYRLQKFVALICVTFVCLTHIFSREMGIFVNNTLALYKVALLVFVVVAGLVCLGGGGGEHLATDDPYGIKNLDDAFSGESKSPYDYASALLGVLYSFQGWENANYVLSEVKRPRGNESKTFKRAVLFAFLLVYVLYILANVAYFAVSTTQELKTIGISVAANFFVRVFGGSAFVTKGLKVLIAMSAFGNIVAVSYANSRVKQEIARRKILPFSNYWARDSPYGTPVGALTLHWIFTVIVILATPNYTASDEAYNLVSIIFTYAHTWVGIFVAIGLVIQYRLNLWRPAILNWGTLRGLISFYVILNIFIIVLIWWPSNTKIPSYIAPVVATGVLGFGIIYWTFITKLLPTLGCELTQEEVLLVDGSRTITYKWFSTGFASRVYLRWVGTHVRE